MLIFAIGRITHFAHVAQLGRLARHSCSRGALRVRSGSSTIDWRGFVERWASRLLRMMKHSSSVGIVVFCVACAVPRHSNMQLGSRYRYAIPQHSTPAVRCVLTVSAVGQQSEGGAHGHAWTTATHRTCLRLVQFGQLRACRFCDQSGVTTLAAFVA